MLTNAIQIEKVMARVISVDLRPRFRDWRDGDVAHPELGFCVKCAIPVPGTLPAEIVVGTLWIPTELSKDPVTGLEEVDALGFESGTPPVPKGHRDAATPVVGEDGTVTVVDGAPVPAATEKPGTSHWCVCRFVPVRSGAALELKNAVLGPKRVPDGPQKDSLVIDKAGAQCVSVKCDDWTACVLETKRAGGSGKIGPMAGKGARMPEWLTAD